MINKFQRIEKSIRLFLQVGEDMLYSNKMPYTQALVDQELSSISSLFNTRPNSNNYFGQRLADLKVLQKTLEEQEQKLYKELNITDIKDLQRKTDQYSGLLKLGGASLASKINKDIIDEEAMNTAAINRLINQLFTSSNFYNQIQSSIFNQSNNFASILSNNIDFRNNVSNILSSHLNSPFVKAQNNDFGINKLLTNIVYENGVYALQKLANDKEITFSSSFLKRFRDAVEALDSGTGVAINIDQLNEQHWAGWKLKKTLDKRSLNQKEKENIRNNIFSTLCKYSPSLSAEEKTALYTSLKYYPIAALSATSAKHIQGIIGEIAAGAFLLLLSNGKIKKPKFRHTGSMYTSGTTNQSHIDIILNEFGFQIKNYNEFAFSDSLVEGGIQLSKHYKLPTLTQQLLLNESLTIALNTFYGIKGFNTKKEGTNYTADVTIQEIDSTLNRVYLYYPDKLLNLQDKLDLDKDLKLATQPSNFYNTFWFMSGQVWVPSSKLLEKIILFFEQWDNPWKNTEFELETSSSYKGKSYPNFPQGAHQGSGWPVLGDIVNATTVYINYNFYLDNLFAWLSS